jgi:SNF2 family DNA or RNA helicase
LIYVTKIRQRFRLKVYLPDDIAVPLFGYQVRRERMHRRWKHFKDGVPDRVVTAVYPSGRELSRCIKVDGPGSLYVAEHFIMTHNTIQTLGVINGIQSLKSALIVCPASLKKNWLREAKKWLVNKQLSMDIADGRTFPKSDIVFINYDVLNRHRGVLRERDWDLISPDEHHYAKNKDSGRTKELHGGVEIIKEGSRKRKYRIEPIPAQRLLMLSGTPLANKTGDLWTTVAAADPNGLGRDYYDFHKQYCGAYYDSYGTFIPNGEPTDAVLAELNALLKARFMIRRLKAEVLTQLPPKVRQIVPLPADGLKKKIAAERAAMTDLLDIYEKMVGIRKEMSDDDLVSAVMRIKPETWEAYAKTTDSDAGNIDMPLTRLANARQDLAIAKLPMVIEYVRNLREQGEKVVIFAYHRAVIEGLKEAFPNAACVYGDTPMESKRHPERTRQGQVDRFQDDPMCGEFIGQYTAAGTGWTLTASKHFVAAELTFVPHELLQGEDRCHRIGSEIHDCVWAHHLVVEGSLDDTFVIKLVRKMEVIEKALN